MYIQLDLEVFSRLQSFDHFASIHPNRFEIKKPRCDQSGDFQLWQI